MRFEKPNESSAKENAETDAIIFDSIPGSLSDSEKDTASIATLRAEIATLNKSVQQTTQWETLKQFGIEPYSVKAHDAIERLVQERENEIHRLEQERITAEHKAVAAKEHAHIAQIHAELDILNEAVHRGTERETLKKLGVSVPEGTRTHDFIEAEANRRLDVLKRLQLPRVAESAAGDAEKYRVRDMGPVEAKTEPSKKESIKAPEEFHGLNLESPRGYVTLPQTAHLAQFDKEPFHAIGHKDPNRKGFEKGFEYNINQEALKGVLLEVDGGQLFRADTDSRFFVICKVQNIHVPFYISSDGTDGKRVNEWYPFFGRVGESGWLIKGKVNKKTGDMFYSQEISRVQNVLNENLKFPAEFFQINGTVRSAEDGRTVFDLRNYLKYKRIDKSAQITGYHPDPKKIGREDTPEVDKWIREIVASIKTNSAEQEPIQATALAKEVIEPEQFHGLNFESTAGRVILPKDARPAQLKPGSWVPEGLMVHVGEERVQVRIDRDALKDVLLESGGAVVHILSGDKGPERRHVVLAKVGNAHVPFYRSSMGTDGKKQGEWYPFFGHTGEWVIKGEIADDGSMTYLPEITRIQKILNKHLILPESRYINDKDFNIRSGDAIVFSVGDEIPMASLLNSSEFNKPKSEPQDAEQLYVARVTGYEPSEGLHGYNPSDAAKHPDKAQLANVWMAQILQEIQKAQPVRTDTTPTSEEAVTSAPATELVPDIHEVPTEETQSAIIVESGRYSAPRAETVYDVSDETETNHVAPSEERHADKESTTQTIEESPDEVAAPTLVQEDESLAAESDGDAESEQEFLDEEKIREGRLRHASREASEALYSFVHTNIFRDNENLVALWDAYAIHNIKSGISVLENIGTSLEHIDFSTFTEALIKIAGGLKEANPQSGVGHLENSDRLRQLAVSLQELSKYLQEISQNVPEEEQGASAAMRELLASVDNVERFLSQRAQLVEDIYS